MSGNQTVKMMMRGISWVSRVLLDKWWLGGRWAAASQLPAPPLLRMPHLRSGKTLDVTRRIWCSLYDMYSPIQVCCSSRCSSRETSGVSRALMAALRSAATLRA